MDSIKQHWWHNYGRLGWYVALLTAVVAAESTLGNSPGLNGDFRDGLAGWVVHPAGATVSVVDGVGPDGSAAARLNTMATPGGLDINSLPFAVKPSTSYRIEAAVKRLAGDGRFKVAIGWQDENHSHLSYSNSWTGQLVGKDWEKYSVGVISPANARFACILAGVEVRSGCYMSQIGLVPGPDAAARLAVDLLCEPVLPDSDAESSLTVRLENMGDVLIENLRGRLELPAGLTSPDKLEFSLENLAYEDVSRTRYRLTGYPKENDATIGCVVTGLAGDKPVRFEQQTQPFVTMSRKQALPVDILSPVKSAATKIKLGCYYFPVMLDWYRSGWGVSRVDYLKPTLGYYDESKPEVADWHIRWAAEHGISYFVFDWYYNQGLCYLNDALEKGFLKSRYVDRMQFCIDWCNEGPCTQFKPLSFSDESLAGFVRVICERYFNRANYLRVEGRPVVLIHQPWRIVNAHGGWDGCRAALDKMRAIARGYGYPGIYFVAVQNHPVLLEYASGGFDAVTAYAYGFCDVAWGGPNRSLPFEALMPRHASAFTSAQKLAHAQGLDYIPSAWVGWDDAARSRGHAVRTMGNTPAAFRRMIELLPKFVEKDTKLALFEAWNEWGEGTVVEPGERYGFGYLDAIRDVLSDQRGPHVDAVPTEADRLRFQTKLTWAEINDDYFGRYADSLGMDKGLHLTFDSMSSLWLAPAGQVLDVRIENGALIGRSVGHDPQLLGPPMMNMPADRASSVRIRMSVSAGKKGQLYWASASKPEFSDDRSVTFELIADGQMHDYVLRLDDHPQWQGTIRQLRFDPTDTPADWSIDRFSTQQRTE